jgi:hypothetical protein
MDLERYTSHAYGKTVLDAKENKESYAWCMRNCAHAFVSQDHEMTLVVCRGAGASECMDCEAGKYSHLPTSSVTCGGTCGAGCSPSSEGTSGTFSDGSGNSNYGNNEDCWWLISAPIISASFSDISVSFSSFDTESGYDYVSIYRCDTATCDGSSERILRQAGTLSPSNVYSSSTGFLKVTFTSDSVNHRSGFTAEWSVVQGELWTCNSMSCLSAVPA